MFHLREDHTGIELSDDIEVHFLELTKLDDRSIPLEGGLINWLLFLKGADKTNWEVLKMNEPTLKKSYGYTGIFESGQRSKAIV